MWHEGEFVGMMDFEGAVIALKETELMTFSTIAVSSRQ